MFRPGMGGGNMQQLLKQAQKMQAEMQAKQMEAEKELEETVLSAQSGGGMVEVKITGKKKIVEIKIKPECVDPDDVEMLEDLVTACVNEALTKADELEKSKQISLPGGFGGMF